MSSSTDTSITDLAPAAGDAPVTSTRRRHRRTLRLLAVLAAIGAVALANTACTPRVVAQIAVSDYWGHNSTCAGRVVQRESGWNTNAVNPVSGTTGLFQIHPTHATWMRARWGYSMTDMRDPRKNSQVAKALSAEAHRIYGDGWQPWRTGGRIAPGAGCPA